MEIGERIRQRRIEMNMSQDELAKKVGYKSRSSINKIEGDGRGLPQSKIAAFAKALDTTPSYLMGWTDETIRAPTTMKNIIRVYSHDRPGSISKVFGQGVGLQYSKRIPVLGRVAAGIPIEAQQEVLDWEEITGEMALSGEYFCLRIDGDSMEPKFSKGDVIIVRQQETADSDDIVVAMVNGSDAVCKRLKKYEDGIALVSTNPAYQPMFFSNKEIETLPVRILGVVKELRAKF